MTEMLRGTLYGHYETGTEGVVWTLNKDGFDGYESMEFIKEGDRLTVFAADGGILFDGTIKEDRTAGWTEYPRNPGNGQPVALGYWVHWTQTGWTPDAWASLFMAHDPPLRAELTRATRAPS